MSTDLTQEVFPRKADKKGSSLPRSQRRIEFLKQVLILCMHALEVCAERDAIALSSCQDILLIVLIYFRDVLYQ